MTDVVKALRAYQQADEDGVMVLVSRQACDEAASEIELLRERLNSARDELVKFQRHRDHWRAFAKGLRDQPTDFLT